MGAPSGAIPSDHSTPIEADSNMRFALGSNSLPNRHTRTYSFRCAKLQMSNFFIDFAPINFSQ